MKNIKGIVCSFVLLIVAGMLITLTTKNVISHKREELYAYQEGTSSTVPAIEASTTAEVVGNGPDGPMSNAMTKDKYLEPIKAEELVIADLWAETGDDGSAMRVVLYERNYWDNQLDAILQMLYEILTAENMDALKQEETSFVAERESLSQEAAKAAGETFTGLQYSKEHARLTKEKTYELIGRYFDEE